MALKAFLAKDAEAKAALIPPPRCLTWHRHEVHRYGSCRAPSPAKSTRRRNQHQTTSSTSVSPGRQHAQSEILSDALNKIPD
jgi:hypothetical protein